MALVHTQLSLEEVAVDIEVGRLTLRQAVRLFEIQFLPDRERRPEKQPYARSTQRSYRQDVRQLIGFLADRQVEQAAVVTRADLAVFLRGFQHLSDRYQHRKRAAVTTFFAFLTGDGYLRHNPARGLVVPVVGVKQPQILNPDEIKALRLTCAENVRDRAIIELFLATGIRLQELLGLTTYHLALPLGIAQETPGSITVAGKGAAGRQLSLTEAAAHALQAWMKERPRCVHVVVFVGNSGLGVMEPLSERSTQRLLKKYGEQAGIQGLTATRLRDTCAVDLVARGVQVEELCERLGIASSTSVGRYLRFVDATQAP